MIRSFKDKETEKIYRQQYSGKLPGPMQKTALRKLIMIDHAESLNDLLVPPGNRLESLSGKRKGHYSIRINNQYRICFEYRDNDFHSVEICDYH